MAYSMLDIYTKYFNRKELIPHFPYELFSDSSIWIATELPFDPWLENMADISEGFLNQFMKLPKEIRDKTYTFLPPNANAGERVTNYIDRWPKYSSLLLPTHKKQDYPTDPKKIAKMIRDAGKYLPPESVDGWHRRKEDCLIYKRLSLFQFLGMAIDGKSENSNALIGYVYSLVSNSGMTISAAGVWSGYDETSDKGALPDFLEWFWRKWLTLNPERLNGIQNLTLDAPPTPISYLSWHDSPEAINLDEIARDKMVLKYFHNLQKLTVFATLSIPLIHNYLNNPGAFPWIARLKKIPVARKFEFLLAARFDWHEPYVSLKLSDIQMLQMQLDWQGKLRNILMPYSLSVGTTMDLPEDLGLKALFSGMVYGDTVEE